MNIYDIAKLSGVSIATVSRVLNQSSKVSDKTRQKVLDAMQAQGYTPNAFARGLGLDSMKMIGILCPDIADDYMAKSVSCLEQSLHEYGYDCLLGCSGYEQESREKYVSLLLSKRIDALILVGSVYCGEGLSGKEVEYIRQAAKQIPVFMINGRVEGENIYCTDADDFQAVYEVTAAFIRRNKKRILFLYDMVSYSGRCKMAGYEAALADAGYPVLGELKFCTKNQIHYAKEMLLAHQNLKFDAVIATEDGLAVAALKYAKAKQLLVPEELSVAGYNDSPLAISAEPELTSVDSRIKEQCNLTVDHIRRVLLGEAVANRTQVACRVMKRCTTDF